MGVLVTTVMLALVWILALAGVSAPGAAADTSTAILAIHWIVYLPLGWMMLASAMMHTVFAKSTGKNIG